MPIHPLLEHGRHLIPAIQQFPNRELLRQFFYERVRHWAYPSIEVECGGLGLFEDLINGLAAESAYLLIPAAAELVLEASSPNRTAQAGFLLDDLVRQSATTEMPLPLAQSWIAVVDKLRSARETSRDSEIAADSLTRWYRREA